MGPSGKAVVLLTNRKNIISTCIAILEITLEMSKNSMTKKLSKHA